MIRDITRLLRSLLRAGTGLLLAALPVSVSAATYTVGVGAGCTHAGIQAALDAAEANAGPDIVHVTRSVAHTQQALLLTTSQQLDLLGGYAQCADVDPDGVFTIVDGAGGATEPVVRITVNSGGIVRLRHLTIRGGDEDGSGKGGGIYFKGNGSLQLRHMAVIDNLATYGGGIYAEGSGIDAELILENDVVVVSNTAREDGGGIYVEGLEMAMRDPDSIIALNKAQGTSFGLGGGLLVRSTSSFAAHAFIGGGGVGTIGTISSNTARSGGGVAVVGDDANLHVYTTDADKPTSIRDNFASNEGGGLYVVADGTVRLWNAVLADNVAPSGAAFSLVGDVSHLSANRGGAPAGAVPCPLGAPCGRIVGNIAADGNGQPTDGAVIRLEDSPILDLRITAPQGGLLLQGNRGGRLIDAPSGPSGGAVIARNVLISDNQLSAELIRGTAVLDLFDTTIANNEIGATTVMTGASQDFLLGRSILWQPGKTSVSLSGASRHIDSVIASEVTSLGGGPEAVEVPSPRFIDPLRSDFRLRAASPAIDYTAPIAGDDRDVHGRPRDQRLDGVPRFPGQVRDLGAFERPALSPLVLNAEFAGDLNLWTTPAGHSGDYDSDNAPNSTPGSGSLRVSGSPAAARLLGSFQCIHLPGPGTYRLNGWGHSQGINASQRNALSLLWEFRPDGGEGCIDGPITASGEHYLNGLSVWTSPADPSTIVVPEAQWNHNSSLTILAAVYTNGITPDFNGWFDDITLTLEVAPPVSGLPFADGFEGL